jgi:hypothetical protein
MRVVRRHRLVPMIDFFDDAIGVGGPAEGFGFAVVLAEIAVDRRLEIDQRMEDAALEPPAGKRGKKALDRIRPGARGEVKRPPRMPGEPGPHPGLRRGRLLRI